jgi:hypothetical protein
MWNYLPVLPLRLPQQFSRAVKFAHRKSLTAQCTYRRLSHNSSANATLPVDNPLRRPVHLIYLTFMAFVKDIILPKDMDAVC